MDGSPVISSDDRTRAWIGYGLGIVATLLLVWAMVAFWPDGDDDGAVAASDTTEQDDDEDEAPAGTTTTAPGAVGEPSATSSTVEAPADPTPADLFAAAGLQQALSGLSSAAGDPQEIYEMSIYRGHMILAYRDVAEPGHIDRRVWRDGEAGDAEPNSGGDRANENTIPGLFSPAELDPSAVERSVADAPGRFGQPVEITHVIVNRFLPFDERVLIRVYTTPTDGRSGGGYARYTTTGEFISVTG